MKKLILPFGVILILCNSNQAYAGMPVFDATNFGQAVQQVQQGVQQIQGQANQLIEMKNQVMNQSALLSLSAAVVGQERLIGRGSKTIAKR